MYDMILLRCKILKRHLKMTITLTAAFLVGLILGFIFYRNCKQTNVVYMNTIAYYVKAVSPKGNVFLISVRYFFTSILFVGMFFALSFSIYTLPLSYAVLFIRGLVVGGAGMILISVYKTDGFTVYLLLTFIQSVLLSSVLTVITVCNLNFSNYGCKSRTKKIDGKTFRIQNLVFALTASFVISIYGFIALLFIVRPLYSIF